MVYCFQIQVYWGPRRVLSDTFLRTNSPGVIGEVLDGEAIIVNLDTGAYFSLDGAGALVWQAAQAGVTLADAISLAAARYEGDLQQVAVDITALFQELLSEGLVVTAEPSEGTVSARLPVPSLVGNETTLFSKPVLQKYTDMADLLLLDPIHEVGDEGWPQPAPPQV